MALTPNKAHLLTLALIACTTALVYGQFSEHQLLLWDDMSYIANNHHLKDLTPGNLVWMFTNVETANWQPLTWLSYTLNHLIWGQSAFYFLLVNILLHIAAGFMFYLLAYQILRLGKIYGVFAAELDNAALTLIAALAALLFSIHPQHTESVVWTAGRNDILCALFCFASYFFYIKEQCLTADGSAIRDGDTSQNRRHLYLISYALALMAKPMAITVPVILLLFDYMVHGRPKNRDWSELYKRYIKNKVALIVITLCATSIMLLNRKQEISEFSTVSLPSRIINANENFWHYLGSSFFPGKLSPFYPYSQASTENTILGFALIIPTVALFFLLWHLRKRLGIAPLLLLSSYTISIFPVIGLVVLSYSAAADRYTYIATCGLFLLLPYLLISVYRRRSSTIVRAALLIAGGTYCLILGFKTVYYVQVWKNDEPLWQHVIKLYPHQSPIPYLNLGHYHQQQNRYALALEKYRAGLNIAPGNARLLRNMASAYLSLGDIVEAETAIQQLLKFNADLPMARYSAGEFYLRLQRFDLAEQQYESALQLAPKDPSIIFRNAHMQYLKKQPQGALRLLTLVLTLNPEHIPGLQLQAQIAYDSGEFDKARKLVQQIEQLVPDSAFVQQFRAHDSKLQR